MVEYGRKDRKIGLFQPSKCPKIPEKSGENGLKSRQNAEKNQRQNPGGGILKGRAWRAEPVTDCHRIAPGRAVVRIGAARCCPDRRRFPRRRCAVRIDPARTVLLSLSYIAM